MLNETLQKLEVVSTTLEGGELRANLGQGDAGTIPDATFWGTDGFISRPNDKNDDGACLALFATQGNSRRVIATKDNRHNDKYGELAPGDRAIVTENDARVLVKNSNSSISLLTKNGGEELMVVQLNGDAGDFTILIGGPNGACSQIKVKPDKMFLGVSGGGSITIDSQGVTIGGAHFACNTKGGNFGVVGNAAPLAPVQSIMLGVTGMAATPAPFWTVSNS